MGTGRGPIEIGVVKTSLNTRVAQLLFSLGSLQFSLYFDSPRHQFVARYL